MLLKLSVPYLKPDLEITKFMLKLKHDEQYFITITKVKHFAYFNNYFMVYVNCLFLGSKS